MQHKSTKSNDQKFPLFFQKLLQLAKVGTPIANTLLIGHRAFCYDSHSVFKFQTIEDRTQKILKLFQTTRYHPSFQAPEVRNVQKSRFPDLCLHERRRRSGLASQVLLFRSCTGTVLDRSITDPYICSFKINVKICKVLCQSLYIVCI